MPPPTVPVARRPITVRLRDAGVDLITLGDHIYKKAEIISTLEQEERICKPANLPPAAPGKEFALATAANGTTIAAISLLGGRSCGRPTIPTSLLIAFSRTWLALPKS